MTESVSGSQPHHHWRSPARSVVLNRTIGWCSKPQILTIRYDPRDVSEIRVYDHDTFVCVAIDEDHPNLRLSLRDIEAARRARRRELRRTINDRIPSVTSREEPHITEPVRRRRRLRTYEED